MTSERHQQVKEIFLAACDLEPAQAAAMLDRACGQDPELRREVESLLLNHFTETIIRTVVPQAQPPAERFPPGTVLAGRYRILGPLGRGGMGVVYRADDLKLEQPVALKFLSPERSADPAWLRRYENEVRLARKVTHPNVLRVYDLVETEGEVFISMEYVGGEDLAALLCRIGRLAGDKATDVARQLCVGLGAAHDQGVLHRDLKPANVMIDGRGQVRIADFGIAALAASEGPRGPAPGTPAYMAPELFEGGRPSVRSDLYGLGMVLYEAITGQEPFAGHPPAPGEPAVPPARPSTLVPDVDAALEAAVLGCLQRDPRQRPDSAYAVAATLPGGDPLRLALAAGETPSPSMVAAAGGQEPLPLRGAFGWLVAGLVALVLVVALADRTFFLPQAGLAKPPAVLADRAEQMIRQLGYDAAGKERGQGFAVDPEYLRDGGRDWPAAYFWYRAGDVPLVLPALLGEPSATDVLTIGPEAVHLRLDGEARLWEFLAGPDPLRPAGDQAAPVEWSSVFELAGLNIQDFRPASPERPPPMYADRVLAWTGSRKDSATPLVVRGASLGGHVVLFQVCPAERADDGGVAALRPLRRAVPLRRLILQLAAVLAAGVIAWHNFRTGRGDHRGARRVAFFMLLLGLGDWVLGEQHSAILTAELASLYVWTARAILTAAIAWLCYFAVEPYVRRFWPQVMVTWSRVLGGRFRDPLVGRDILLGGAAGILLVLVLQTDNLAPGWLGLARPLPCLPPAACDVGAMIGLPHKLALLVAVLINSILLGLIVLLLVLVARLVIRRPVPALAVSWLGLTAIQAMTAGPDVGFPWVTSGVVVAAAIALLTRAGLVALMAAALVLLLLTASPLTSDFTAWYAPSCLFAVGLSGLLLVYGFFTARAGHPFPWWRLLDAE